MRGPIMACVLLACLALACLLAIRHAPAEAPPALSPGPAPGPNWMHRAGPA